VRASANAYPLKRLWRSPWLITRRMPTIYRAVAKVGLFSAEVCTAPHIALDYLPTTRPMLVWPLLLQLRYSLHGKQRRQRGGAMECKHVSVGSAYLQGKSAPIGASAQGFFTSVSSNGTQNVIIWAVQNQSLYAFNAEPDGGTLPQLFSFQLASNGNNVVPVVASGRVFVATDGLLTVLGLGGSGQAPQPPSGMSAAPISWSDRITGKVVSIKGDVPPPSAAQWAVLRANTVLVGHAADNCTTARTAHRALRSARPFASVCHGQGSALPQRSLRQYHSPAHFVGRTSAYSRATAISPTPADVYLGLAYQSDSRVNPNWLAAVTRSTSRRMESRRK